ncbi:MAG: hypothetical protein GXY20_09475 [Clostridiales bacterium]|nr:hypothetical protein [Clostridiales bacterium]
MDAEFIKQPNLPDYRVKSVILGEKYGLLGKSLSYYGINVLPMPGNPLLAKQVAYHADLSIFHLGGRNILISKAIISFATLLREAGFNVIISQATQNDHYPSDIGLNACLIKGNLFHMIEYTDKFILQFALSNKIVINNVNQGYTKCSVCVLDENHIITSDKGISNSALRAGIDCLLINPGGIKLTGYDTGFIGGSSFKISKNAVAFTGTLKYLKDEKRILDYISALDMEVIFLTDEPCFDVGSIIPLTEL